MMPRLTPRKNRELGDAEAVCQPASMMPRLTPRKNLKKLVEWNFAGALQ